MKLSLNKRKIGLIAVEVLAVIFLFVLLGGGILAWRLLQGPVDMEFARPYVEAALKDSEAGFSVEMDRIVLQWPEVDGPILLGLQDGKMISSRDGSVIASIDEAGIALSKVNLMFGRIVPLGLILKRPTLRVIRHEDNSFDIGLAESKVREVEPAPEALTQNPLQTIIDILVDPESAESVSTHLSLLRSLRVEDAQVMVDDKLIDMTWVLPKLSAALERQKNGVFLGADVTFSKMRERIPTLKVEAFLNRETKIVHLDTMLEYFEPNFLAQRIPALAELEGMRGRIDAHLTMDVTTDQDVLKADITALAEKGSFDIPAFSDAPVLYKDLGFVAAYDAETKILAVKKAQATLNEQVHMDATAELIIDEAGITGPVHAKLADFEQAQIGPLWPASLQDEAAYEWVVEKLADGRFSDVYVKLDARAQKGADGWDYDADQLEFGFGFSDMTIQYKDTLAPVKNAAGVGVFKLDEETLDVDIASATLLDMSITKADVHLRDIIEAGKGVADIQIALSGSVPSVLNYIKDEPIGVVTPIDIEGAKGAGDLDIKLEIPTRKDLAVEDIKISVTGTVNEATLPGVYKGMTLSGGPFELSVEENLFSVKGKGQLDGRAADLTYQEYLDSASKDFKSKISGKISGVDEDMRAKIGMDLSTFMRGPANIDVTYTEFTNGKAEADVAADLGSSTLFVEPFDYTKAPGEAATATLKAFLTNGDLKEIKDLSGTAPDFSLGTTQLAFRQDGEDTELASGSVSNFTLGETAASLSFSFDAQDVVSLDVKGTMLDARPFLNGKDDGAEQAKDKIPMRLNVAVERMRTTDEDQVQNAQFSADIDTEGRYNTLSLDGAVGQGRVVARFKPDATGKRAFYLEATDAGAALKAFGVYENVIGGRLVISGVAPDVNARNILGTAEMTDFRVVRAPALARLLGIMSLPGLGQLLNNEGLVFTRLQSDFEWLYQPQGSVLSIKEGRTSGNSLGLTFEGNIELESRTIDIKGTVIPLSGINSLIGNIPLVGDILTGGTGSLIAATYTMRGSGADVDTSVNPLSVLTPGILRRVLFE